MPAKGWLTELLFLTHTHTHSLCCCTHTDYATGFLGAYGVILGLLERQAAAKEGKALARGVLVHTSLVQAATWMAGFGARAPGRLEWFLRVTRLLWHSDARSTKVADLSYLPPGTACRMSITPPNRHCREMGGRMTRRRMIWWWRRSEVWEWRGYVVGGLVERST